MADDDAPAPRQITARVVNATNATIEQADGPVYILGRNWVQDFVEASPWRILLASITAGIGLSGGAIGAIVAWRVVGEVFRMITP